MIAWQRPALPVARALGKNLPFIHPKGYSTMGFTNQGFWAWQDISETCLPVPGFNTAEGVCVRLIVQGLELLCHERCRLPDALHASRL